jgi:hypothetical protein
MEVAVTMPNIVERLRWKVGLGLVVVVAGFAAAVAPSADLGSDSARSSWGLRAVEPAAAVTVEPTAVQADVAVDVA